MLIDPVQASATNAAAIATIDGLTGAQLEGVVVNFSYSQQPTGGRLIVSRVSGGTPGEPLGLLLALLQTPETAESVAICDVDILSGGPDSLPLAGFITQEGEGLSATLADGGSGVTGKVSLSAKYA